MQFVKQRKTLPIQEIQCENSVDATIKRHGELLPNSIRAIISGPSGVGKTNVVISLIESPNGLRFQNV